MPLSRRRFVGGFAAALTYLGVAPEGDLLAFGQSAASAPGGAPYLSDKIKKAMAEYDGYAKLSNNENPYGPPESVMKAMTDAFKYANRYGAPDGGIVDAIAAHHGVKTENVLIGEGSSELLDISDAAFTRGGRKVVGADPTYATIFQYAAGTNSEGILIPLRADYTQDIPAMIRAVKTNYRDIGLVYLCNPNNPTGVIVRKEEVKQLLDAVPDDVPVLIDEAYHHFVEDPSYETSTKYVLEDRSVIVLRTFSKILALAGMRLGYAVAPKRLLDRMKVYSINYGVNQIVRYGGVAGLADTAAQDKVRRLNTDLRTKTTKELEAYGYPVIPSQTNFFMVQIDRDVVETGAEFKKRGVLVGRPFPPMTKHLRVSVGSASEMDRFMKAFKEIFPVKTSSGRLIA
jgi:histidinol-phosphate aminotransferase